MMSQKAKHVKIKRNEHKMIYVIIFADSDNIVQVLQRVSLKDQKMHGETEEFFIFFQLRILNLIKQIEFALCLRGICYDFCTTLRIYLCNL